MRALLLLLLVSVAWAYVFDSANLTFEISQGRTNYTFVASKPERDIELAFPLPVAISTCEVKGNVEGNTILSCRGNESISVSGLLDGSIISRRGVKVFSAYFPVHDVYKNFSVSVIMPPATSIADEEKALSIGLLPVEPDNYETDTDGRRIYVKWMFSNPELGKKLVFRVVYEEKSFPYWYFLIPFLAVPAILFMRRTSVTSILTPEEKAVYEVIAKRKKVTQNIVVREVDMSKATVSRIVKRLEERGLIKKERKGRVNILEVVR